MSIQKPNKLSQSRYFINYNKRVCHITPNYLEPGQNKAINLYLIRTKVLPYYWLNVTSQNPSNLKSISLPFYQVDKGNMFRESWTVIQSTTKDEYSNLKCPKLISLQSFDPLSIYSNRQSTPKSVYHIFNNSSFGSFLKRTHPPKQNPNETNHYRQSKGIN